MADDAAAIEQAVLTGEPRQVHARVAVLLDRERRVDDHGGAGVPVADEVRGTTEVVVDELPEEQHGVQA